MRLKQQSLAILAAAALIQGCGSSGGGDDSSSSDDETAIDTNDFTPTALAVSLPTTLTSSEGSSLRLTQDSEPGTSQSQGYWELTDKVQRIQLQLAELTLNNAILDNVYSSSCGGTLDSGSCTTTDACATITKQIINNIKATLGEEHFATEGDGLSHFEGWVGSEHCFSSVTLTALTSNDEGYNFQAEMVLDDNNSITQYWNETKDKVKVVHAFRDDFSMEGEAFSLQESSSSYYSGTSTFVFDSNAGTFKARNTFSYSYDNTVEQGEEAFTIQSLDDKLDLNGVVLKGTISSEFNGNKWSLGIEGNVDNNGGFVRTQSGWSTYEVSAMTLSAACTEGIDYGLYPSGTTATELTGDNIFFEQIGSFWCYPAASSLTGDSVYIFNQLPSDPTGLVIMEMAWPEYTETSGEAEAEAFYPTVTASALTMASLTAAPSTQYHCYEEQFSAAGSIEAWRAADGKCDSGNLNWISGDGSFGDEYFYDDSVAGEFQEISVTISGVTESEIQALSGFSDFLPYMYIAVSGSNLSTLEQYSDSFYKQVIGGAWATSPDATADTSGISNYQVDFWGSTDQLSNAELFVESFNSTTGEMSVVQVSGASFTASE
ncbi:hypothetical protein [Pseudobacteriovorax antillogorgiicola]|uniref:Uncharacterized protein n=1 Tax=Pseudobacteriovorax antillogorgiicola TaxID=1513793 RepID=A0A1Y6BKF4_9BACT|nr:hypothetical protein [Pseudobacteriovorax antillogorgiicola]TCS54711.1 hypothetical protein EDD56_106224 [Pseudobacteriovorax antillogorgiicola]SMF16141.1 hypothetical protein SAMN06296036_10619 [Pseudobacteriovorax antillogorgiicola]